MGKFILISARGFFALIAALFFTLSAGTTAQAQDATWLQIEAQPSLRAAQDRARAYANVFDNVHGFRMGSNWYAIVLGPYSTADAAAKLAQLRRENLIPTDSYLAEGRAFGQSFWPVAGQAATTIPVETETPAQTETTATTPVETPPAETIIPEETQRQARASENALSRDEKKALQVALAWEGFYTGAIDGAFGRGTRASMAAYQQAMAYEDTGVLTTRQRARLIDDYNAVLASLGMANYSDAEAFVSVTMPAAMVEFDRYEAPFVHFKPATDDGVQMMLISQTGDQATLFGLYEIMQTLEIVPLEGDRERGDDSFTLTGQNGDIHSYTYAMLDDGTVKGFTLVWPAGDQKRMDRVIAEMRASFASTGSGALDELLGDAPEQRIDLLSGLEIRRPTLSRSGFYLDGQGTVLTSAEFAGSCRNITLDETYDAELTYVNADLGIAVLRPTTDLAPLNVAKFADTTPRLKSDIAVSGYSYEGALGAPTLTFGQLSDIRGLHGETDVHRLALATQPGDTGGPILDAGGAVVGMLKPNVETGAQQLPNGVQFSTPGAAIQADLLAQGITAQTITDHSQLHPVDLTERAMGMTVLVSCWN